MGPVPADPGAAALVQVRMQRSPRTWRSSFSQITSAGVLLEKIKVWPPASPVRASSRRMARKGVMPAAGDEHTGPLVTDGAERLGHQQLGARLQARLAKAAWINFIAISFRGVV